MKKNARRGQKNYNQRAWSSVLEPGDHVLVRNLTPRGGTGKLRNYWEETVHVVQSRRGPDSPVYTVEPLEGTGQTRVLHRNLLLPCPYLVENPEANTPDQTQGSNKNKTRPRTRRLKDRHNTPALDTDSSSEEEYYLWTAARQMDTPLNAEATEFCPQSQASGGNPDVVTPLEAHSEGEDAEEGKSMVGERDAPAVEARDEQREAEMERDMPKRVRKSRRVYTYDQLGQPTLKQLNIYPVDVKRPSSSTQELPDRSTLMYPFCYY